MERRPLYLLRQARGLLSLSLILGATWFIGVANTFLQYMPLTFIFTILNSLQGTEYELGQYALSVLPISIELGSVASPVIQANGRLSFEVELRSGGLLYCVSQ